MQTHRVLSSEFDTNGFAVLPPLLSLDDCDRLNASIEALRNRRVGSRQLLCSAPFGQLACKLRELPPISALLPDQPVAVQCTLFAKVPGTNWSVAPHQDLSIPVSERVDSDECAGWSRKESDLFVQPPISVLETLVAVRLQLDDHADETGPLEVVPESHRLGRLSSVDMLRRIQRHRVRCLPERGGAIVMRPLTIHASSKAAHALPRRVLHFLFGPSMLPLGLRWAKSA